MKFLHCKDCYFYGTIYEEVAAKLGNGQHWCSEHQKFKTPDGFCDHAIEKEEEKVERVEFYWADDVRELVISNHDMSERVYAEEELMKLPVKVFTTCGNCAMQGLSGCPAPNMPDDFYCKKAIEKEE